MRDVPVPTKLWTNAMSSTLNVFRGLVTDNITEASVTDSEYETAYTATLDNKSDTSVETYAKRRHCQKKERKKKDKNKGKKRLSSCERRRDTNMDNEVYTCPSCKKFERRKAHPHIPHNKCMRNKTYKGYHFKSIYDKPDVNVKPPHKFLSKLDGYKDKDARSDKKSE